MIEHGTDPLTIASTGKGELTFARGAPAGRRAMTTPTDLEREVARAIAAEIFGEDGADEYADCEDATDGYISIPDLARAAIAACFRWKPIGPEQMNGEEWIVGFDFATVWVTRAAAWDDGELWQDRGFESQHEARGWWSYRNSVTQEKLDEHYTPTHYLCLTPPEPDG